MLNFDGPRRVPPEQASAAQPRSATTASASSLDGFAHGDAVANYNLAAWNAIRAATSAGARRLRMAPGFTLFAVVSLALGIGVCTAVYSAVRTLLLDAARDPGRQPS